MKLVEEALAGTLFVAALVVGGFWYADELQFPHCAVPSFNAGDESPRPVQNVSVNHVDWSADGEELLSLSRGEPDCIGALALHALALDTTGRILMDVREPIFAAAFAPDALHVLVGTHDGELLWITIETSETTTLARLQRSSTATFTSVAIAEDETLVAGGTSTGSIYVYDPACQTSCILTVNRESGITDLRFSSDGKQLVSAQSDGRVSLWDLAAGKLLQEFTGHQGPATAAALLPGDQRILTAGLDDTIRIWDTATGRELWCGDFGLGGITTAAVSADGATAAWGGYNGKIIVWDLAQGQMKFDTAARGPAVLDLKFSRDGTLLAAAGNERMIRLYDIRTGAEKKRIQAVLAKTR